LIEVADDASRLKVRQPFGNEEIERGLVVRERGGRGLFGLVGVTGLDAAS
jgi:hypothetical protein